MNALKVAGPMPIFFTKNLFTDHKNEKGGETQITRIAVGGWLGGGWVQRPHTYTHMRRFDECPF